VASTVSSKVRGWAGEEGGGQGWWGQRQRQGQGPWCGAGGGLDRTVSIAGVCPGSSSTSTSRCTSCRGGGCCCAWQPCLSHGCVVRVAAVVCRLYSAHSLPGIGFFTPHTQYSVVCVCVLEHSKVRLCCCCRQQQLHQQLWSCCSLCRGMCAVACFMHARTGTHPLHCACPRPASARVCSTVRVRPCTSVAAHAHVQGLHLCLCRRLLHSCDRCVRVCCCTCGEGSCDRRGDRVRAHSAGAFQQWQPLCVPPHIARVRPQMTPAVVW
jgi:hypothetical protein